LTVHVTEFFRDPEVFAAVKSRVCPDLQASFSRETWSVWSAGSSTGEEAYSLGILIQEWHRDHEGPDYEILGTDIDPESVFAAERGVYPVSAIEKVAPARQYQWFLKTGRRVEIIPECRRHVRFQIQDLTGPWEVDAPRYHLVFCRNLLIYLNAAQHQNLYSRFARVIRPGGFLVLGRTEAMLGAGRSFFQCVDARNRLYRRAD
jgi:chemotaxis methyl-accepting protein methylase